MKTIPNSKPKWAKSIPVFRPKRHKNPTRWGGTYLHGLYKGVTPPHPEGTGHQISLIESTFELFCAKQILMVCTSCKTLYNVTSHTDVINRGLSRFVFIDGSWSLISCRGRGEMPKREPPDFRSPEVSISAQLLLPHLHSVSTFVNIFACHTNQYILIQHCQHLQNTFLFLFSLLVCTRHKI